MKVIHLIGGGDVGGAKTHVLSLINELKKTIEVKLICLRAGEFATEAKQRGIDVDVIRTSNFINDIKMIISIIKSGNYDIIHSHGSKANTYAILVKCFCKVRTITTIHSDYRLDYLHSKYKNITYGLLNRISLRFIDYYIGVSNRFKLMLINRNFDPNRIFVLYNGISFNTTPTSCSRTYFAHKYNIDLCEEDVVVGMLVRLHPVKGVDTFLKAAHEVLKRNPNIKFVIAGDGEEKKRLELFSKILGIHNSVYFIGHIDAPNDFLNFIDINVMTSLSESFPYTILEGVRLKKATISSDVGGLPDLIESGINGYLFNVGDYLKLSEQIYDLCCDKEKRIAMGEKVYKKAKEYFSVEKMAKTQVDIYFSMENTTLKKKKCKTNDVLLSGYYGFNNIGDEVILTSLFELLRNYKHDVIVQ